MPEIHVHIGSLVAQGPSEAGWLTLCELLGALEDPGEIAAAVRRWREPLAGWPARLRRSSASTKRWLEALFDRVVDPRLELLGWASMSQTTEYPWNDPRQFSLSFRHLLLAWARHLQPGFAPPDVLRYDRSDGAHAAGCGGGWAASAWGDEARGVTYEDTWIEHAADDESDDV